jgi:imidazolonepropionase-like amidohydrolase
VVVDGVIARVGSAEEAPVAGSLIAIVGTGKYLKPGLWDMHSITFNPGGSNVSL